MTAPHAITCTEPRDENVNDTKPVDYVYLGIASSLTQHYIWYGSYYGIRTT